MTTRVRYRRSGGFAGTTLTYDAEADELPAALRDLVERLDLQAFARPGPPRGADRFQHELVIERGGRSERAILPEHEVPDELRPLLDWLLERARGG